ncbi:unnamed protein product [Gadus morhua 'NCC']
MAHASSTSLRLLGGFHGKAMPDLEPRHGSRVAQGVDLTPPPPSSYHYFLRARAPVASLLVQRMEAKSRPPGLQPTFTMMVVPYSEAEGERGKTLEK